MHVPLNVSRRAADQLLRISTRSNAAAAAASAGLGLGHVRSGIEAIHRVKVTCPSFLNPVKTCAVIGAPLTYGQPYHGVDNGPQALRDHGLHEGLLRLGWRVIEHGDLKFDPPTSTDDDYEGPGNCKLSRSVGKSAKLLCDTVASHASQGRFVLTLGGDHSIAMGSIAGILKVRPETGVIWVDAHADINPPELSQSGNMHGMPLSFLSHIANAQNIPGCEWTLDIPRLNPTEQLVYVGLRDVDKAERAILQKLNIKAFSMSHVDRWGIGKVMEMALDHLGDRPLHMSYDIDACDPAIAPSTGTAVRGGLTYREAHYVAEAVADTCKLGSMEIVEVNPHFQGTVNAVDLGEETVELGLAITASALGNRIL